MGSAYVNVAVLAVLTISRDMDIPGFDPLTPTLFKTHRDTPDGYQQDPKECPKRNGILIGFCQEYPINVRNIPQSGCPKLEN